MSKGCVVFNKVCIAMSMATSNFFRLEVKFVSLENVSRLYWPVFMEHSFILVDTRLAK